MAQREIGFSLKVNNVENLKRVDELVSKIQKQANIKLNIETGEGVNSLKAIQKTLETIEKNIGTAFGGKSFNTSGVEKANKETQKLKDNVKEVSEITGKIKSESLVQVNGEDVKKITNINNALGETQKRVKSLKTGDVTDTFTTNYDKQEKELDKLIQRIQTMQSKMGTKGGTNGLVNNNLIDESVITNIQNRLNAINTDTPEAEIKALETEIKNLGSSEPQIVRVQNAINSMKTGLEGMKGKYGSLVGDSNSINQLTTYENKIKELEEVLKQLQSGKLFDPSAISKQLGQASNASRELTTAVRSSSSALRLSQQDALSFGDSLKRALSVTGIYTGVYQAVMMVKMAMKEAISTVIELDSAIADLNKVVTLSSSQLSDMKDSAVSMGESYAKSSIEVAKSMAEAGRQYKDTATIQEIAKASLIGSNVMDGTTSDQVAKSLTTVMVSMKKDAKDVMSILDSMNEIQNNFKISSDNMSKGLEQVASTAYTSGVSLEKVEGYLTAVVSSTGASGDEAGNAIKSILAKLYKPSSITTLQKNAGVSVKDEMGQYKDAGVILDELDKKWGTLTQTQKINIATGTAGVQRYNQFMSLMNNYSMAVKATATAEQSAGSVTKENSIYMQTASAKLQQLKTSLESTATKLFDTGAIKGSIDGLNSLVQTFGNLEGVILLSATALAVWKGQAIASAISTAVSVIPSIASYITTLGGLVAEYGVVEVATMEASVATNTLKTSILGLEVSNPLGWLMIAITGAIALFSVFKEKVRDTKEILSDLETSLNDLSTVKKDESSLDAMKKLQDQIKSNTLSVEDNKKAKEELLKLEQNFANSYNGAITKYDEEGNALATNTKLIENQIEAKKRLAKANALGDYKDLTSQINFGGNNTYEVKQGASSGEARIKTEEDSIANYDKLSKKMESGKKLSDYQLKIYKEMNEKLRGMNEAVLKLDNAGMKITGMKMFDFETGKIVDAEKYIKELSTSEKDSTNSSNDAKDGLSKLGDEAEDASKKFSDLADAFSGYTDKVEILKKTLDELNKNGSLSGDTITSIIKTGDAELISALGDKNTIVEKYNNMLGQAKISRDEELKTIIQTAQAQQGLTNEVNNTTQAITNSANTQQQATKQTTDNNAKQYNTDVKNNAQSANSKKEVSKTLTNAMLKNNADFTNTVNSFYGTDVANKINAENEKGNASANVINQTLSANANAVDQMGTHYAMDVENFQKAQKAKLDSLMTLTNNPLDTQNKLKDYKSFVDNGTSNPTYKPVTGSVPEVAYNPVSASYDPVSVNDSGSGSDGGKSATDYTVKYLESMRNAFYSLNNAIDDVKNASDRLSKQIETAYGKDKENLIENRINLLRQEKDLTQQLINQYGAEIWNKRVELDSKVRSMGSNIGFDSSGNITNRNEMLEALRNSVNAMGSYDDASKQAKESAQENVKEIETLISSYDELQNGLASTTSSYDDLTSSIREAYKSMADSVVDGESKIGEVIKNAWQKKLDTVTKYADQLKEKINSTYEQNSYEDDKAKAEKELLDIKQAMNEAVKSGDKELFNTLKKQYQDQQDSINSMIKDKEKDNALNAIDKDTQKFQDAMDEALKPENLTKSITTALQQGYIVVGGEVQKLSDATTQYLKDTQTGTETLTLAMDEYTKSLASALEMYSKINDINNNLGVVTSYTPSNAVNDVNKNWNSIVSQNSVSRAVNISMPINISSVNGVDDLQDQLQDWANTIYKTIDYQLGVK